MTTRETVVTRLVALIAVLSCVLCPRARANAPEDMFGASSRVSGMGGAGTAIARDGSAAYYNPALLARCPDSNVSVDTHRITYGLHTSRTGADAPADNLEPNPSQTRAGLGACLLLPHHLAAGVYVASGLEHLSTVRMESASARPNFPLYGRSLEHLNINVGIAYRPIRQVSIGVGLSVLANSNLSVAVDLPLATYNANGNFQDLGFTIGFRLKPRLAPYVGVLIEPTRRVRIGFSFRERIAMNLNIPMSITAQFLGFTVPVPMYLTANVWYSPRQLSVGVAGDLTRNVTVTGDVTWYGYKDLASNSFPYIRVGDIPGTGGSILGLVGLAQADAPGFRDVIGVRTGIEGRIGGNRHIALRGGYGFRTSALPTPGARNTTLLDGMVHSFTVGAGVAIHNAWDDSQDPFDPSNRRVSHNRRLLERQQRLVLEGERDGDGDGATQETETELEEDPFVRAHPFTARLDLFMRLSVMQGGSDALKEINWGGSTLDFGSTVAVGWR